jgi:hypothetical protein
MRMLIAFIGLLALPALASASTAPPVGDMTGTAYGYPGIIIFMLSFSLVRLENTIRLRKSNPVLLAAGIIWVTGALAFVISPITDNLATALLMGAVVMAANAGVALMGTVRGKYIFGSLLKGAPVIALGYAASLICHFMINAGGM